MNKYSDTKKEVYIGLGSNMDNPLFHIKTACSELAQLPSTKLTKISNFYRNPPLGPSKQADYINAVVSLKTSLLPLELLHQLQLLEIRHGRKRQGEKWGPRSLDLDILLFGQESIHTENLRIPHYDLANRYFFLYPLVEIAPPGLSLPSGKTIRKLLLECPKISMSLV